MKRKRRNIVLAIWIIAVLSWSIPVSAAQSAKLIQKVKIDGTNMTVMCTDTEKSTDYEIKLDGVAVDFAAESVENAATPVTVFCLVDNSGSMSDFKLKLVRETLLQISQSLKEGDSMVIAEVNNVLTIGEPLFLLGERETAIQNIKSSYKDTDLYMGIVKSIEQLVSDETYNPCRSLIILSDGDEWQDDGMTEQEVLSAVEKARIPIYTVALVESVSEVEWAKILGSFARTSCGGKHLTTVDEGGGEAIMTNVSGAEFGKSIWESLMSIQLLHVDLREIEIDQTKVETRLSVVYKSGNNSYEDYMNLSTSDFSNNEPEPDPKPEPQPDPEPKPESNENYWWLIIVGAVAVLSIAIVAMIIAKKTKSNVTGQKEPVAEIIPTEPEQLENPKQGKQNNVEKEPEPLNGMRHSIYMTDIPYGTHKYEFMIPPDQPFTFGRDKRADYILDSTDNNLSGIHFALIITNGKCWVCDEGSTNGTFLQGVPIAGKGWSSMENQSKLRVGGYEYRVIIR